MIKINNIYMEMGPVRVKVSVYKNIGRFGQNGDHTFLQRYKISRTKKLMRRQSKG